MLQVYTVRNHLELAESLLQEGPHPDRARLDAEHLLMRVLGINHAWLIAHPRPRNLTSSILSPSKLTKIETSAPMRWVACWSNSTAREASRAEAISSTIWMTLVKYCGDRVTCRRDGRLVAAVEEGTATPPQLREQERIGVAKRVGGAPLRQAGFADERH